MPSCSNILPNCNPCLLYESRYFSVKIHCMYLFQQWSIIRAMQVVDYLVTCVNTFQRTGDKKPYSLD